MDAASIAILADLLDDIDVLDIVVRELRGTRSEVHHEANGVRYATRFYPVDKRDGPIRRAVAITEIEHA